MKAVALITGEFLREQRWVVLALAVYSGGMGSVLAFAGDHPSRADLIFYAQQQGTLGLLFGVFLISAELRNAQRSRRLLLILSKAVSRPQYLTALVLGSASVSAGFILLTLIVLLSIRHPSSMFIVDQLLLPFLPLAILAICLGLCFSIFLHPFFANTITLLVLGSSFGIASHLHGSAVYFLPGANLFLVSLQRARPAAELSAGVFAVLSQSAFIFALACRIFSRRDLGSSVE